MLSIKPETSTIKRFIFCFILYFSVFFIIGAFTGKTILIVLSFPCPILLSIMTIYIVEKPASVSGKIYWPSEKIPPREQLSADLARARYSKGTGHFDKALSIINQILEKDPDFPDALYLKAHILWEGFENSKGALESLIRVMELVKDNEPIYHRASNYYHEVKKGHIIEN